MSDKINVFEKKSKKTGLKGFFETMLRTYRSGMYLLLFLIIVFICLICFALSIFTGLSFFLYNYELVSSTNLFIKSFILSFCIVLSIAISSVTLLFVTAFFNWLNPFKVKPWKGSWYSLEGIPWYYHNALFYLVRYTILDLIVPSPISTMYFRMMGMKIGKGVVINTSNISDPCLITIEDHATIGGSATLLGHYGQKGFLVLGRVVIRKGAMIGLKASIFGDVEIGESAIVAPHEVVLPKSKVTKGS